MSDFFAQAITSGRVADPRTLGKGTVIPPDPEYAETEVEKIISKEKEEKMVARRQVGRVHGIATFEYNDEKDCFEVRIDDGAFPEMHIHFEISPELFELMKQAKEQTVQDMMDQGVIPPA